MYTGPEPDMDFKYANIVVVMYVTFLYGSGIPSLYLVAFAYFFVTYWVDKYLVLTYYSKPAYLDQSLSLSILSWFKFAVILHLIGGILMYANSNILPTYSSSINSAKQYAIAEVVSTFQFGSLNTTQLFVWIGFMLAKIGLYIIYRLLIQQFIKLWKKCQKNSKFKFSLYEQTIVDQDIYTTIGFKDLRFMYKDDVKLLKQLQQLQKGHK